MMLVFLFMLIFCLDLNILENHTMFSLKKIRQSQLDFGNFRGVKKKSNMKIENFIPTRRCRRV